jgi:hypothetical protein
MAAITNAPTAVKVLRVPFNKWPKNGRKVIFKDNPYTVKRARR